MIRQELNRMAGRAIYGYHFPTKDFDKLTADVQRSYDLQGEQLVAAIAPAIAQATLNYCARQADFWRLHDITRLLQEQFPDTAPPV